MEAHAKSDVAIWDMDGTIFDTERLTLECWEQVCIAHGYQNPRATLYKMIGRTSEDSVGILMADFGERFPLEEMRAEKNIIADERLRRFGIPLKPGVQSALQWLSDRKVPSAVASSTRREKVVSHLERGGLLHHFGVVIGGDQVQRGKPDPEIFLRTADALRVEPDRCVVFEDSVNGVIAAHEAGMRVVMIPDLIEPTPDILARVHHTLQSLEEAIPLLVQLFKD